MAQPPSATQSRPSSAVMAATSSMDDISMNYDKVISLFTSRHSSELYDRHVAAIHRMCRSATNGFAIRELPKVEQVLIFTLELLRKTANSEIADATEHLIRHPPPPSHPLPLLLDPSKPPPPPPPHSDRPLPPCFLQGPGAAVCAAHLNG